MLPQTGRRPQGNSNSPELYSIHWCNSNKWFHEPPGRPLQHMDFTVMSCHRANLSLFSKHFEESSIDVRVNLYHHVPFP